MATPDAFPGHPEQLANGNWITSAATCDARGRSCGIEIEWAKYGGRSEPVRVEVVGLDGPLNAESIRGVLTGSFFVETKSRLEEQLLRLANSPAPGTGRWLGETPTDNLPFRAVARREAASFGVQRGRRLSPLVLQDVASVYRDAYARNLPVTQAIVEAFGVTKSTAGKRIMAARKAGLLDGIGDRS